MTSRIFIRPLLTRTTRCDDFLSLLHHEHHTEESRYPVVRSSCRCGGRTFQLAAALRKGAPVKRSGVGSASILPLPIAFQPVLLKNALRQVKRSGMVQRKGIETRTVRPSTHTRLRRETRPDACQPDGLFEYTRDDNNTFSPTRRRLQVLSFLSLAQRLRHDANTTRLSLDCNLTLSAIETLPMERRLGPFSYACLLLPL
ncbi:hypothetical protein F5146DRAFT_374540 [Armillaria mellea]|nr:hypothetical protein F5146DRAFT_374540 [Armillaria mellea]